MTNSLTDRIRDLKTCVDRDGDDTHNEREALSAAKAMDAERWEGVAALVMATGVCAVFACYAFPRYSIWLATLLLVAMALFGLLAVTRRGRRLERGSDRRFQLSIAAMGVTAALCAGVPWGAL